MKKLSGWIALTAIFVVAVSLVVTQRSSARKVEAGQGRQSPDAQELATRKKELSKSFTDKIASRDTNGQTAQRRLNPEAQAEGADADNDPDLAPGMGGIIDKEDYLRARGDQIAMQRGMDPNRPFDLRMRIKAIEQMEAQEAQMAQQGSANRKWRPTDFTVSAILGAFGSIGPNFLPNGQTEGYPAVQSPVSGRLTAIDIHPTNANIAYVGAAQGGVWRTTDGGLTWTPILDNAQTLAIGAVTVDPVTPTTVFVGTGEGNNNSDGFPGVGIYIIRNADTTPVVTGPFRTRVDGSGTTAGTATDAFLNSSITRIAVDPNNDNRIFVGNNISFAGNPGIQVPNVTTTGLYFSDNAQSANPTFSKVGPVAAGSYLTASNQAPITDIVFEPGSSNNLLFFVDDRFGLNNGGVWRTTNATNAPAAAPTFTRTLPVPVNINGKLAIQKTGSTVTVYAASGESHTQPQPASPVFCADVNGVVRKSVDGGATWSTPLPDADGFCWQQCFYDIAIDVDPTNANNVHLGGWANSSGCDHIYEKSADGGTTFTASELGLHADTHAVRVAPSSPTTVWFGSDGGIFKSVDTGGTWVSQNPNGISALQFQSLAVHPTSRNYTLGGTQDNGTPRRDDAGVWTRADLGDGGYALIDQSSTDTAANMRIYHTRFAQTNAFTYQRATSGANANDGLWESRGCGFTGSINNGFGQAGSPTGTCPTGAVGEVSCPCKATTSVLFYPPMALGPLAPNSVYYGTDRLWRSTDNGVSMTLASQGPITSTIAITTIAVESSTGLTAPRNDNVRLVGLRNGTVFGTITGSSTLVNTGFAPPARTPASTTNRAVGRVAIDPTNPNVAYLTLAYYQSAFNAATSPQVWKTTNLNNLGTSAVTWTPAGNGIPNIPVDSFAIDSVIPNNLYAGTDIGVYTSTDGGATWTPFGTGLPKVAVFDLAISRAQSSVLMPPVLRVATHGRGMYEAPIPIPANVAPVASATPNPAVTNEDTPVQITLTGTDTNDDPLTFTITDPPDHGTLSAVSAPDCSPVNTCTASVTYTPAPNYNGADFFKFKVNDGTVDSAEETVNITVNTVNDLSVSDVTQAEGNSGTSAFTFVVSLDAPAPAGGVTFDISTADGTATAADNDYEPNSVNGATIPEGQTSYQFPVTVNGDTTVEANETFSVNVTNVSGVTVGDGQGTGTIINDDGAPSPGQIIISEFRLRGPDPDGAGSATGELDEFIEIYNTNDFEIIVVDSSPLPTLTTNGWAIVSSDDPTTAKFVVPVGTHIPARGHYLVTNALGYSLSLNAAADVAPPAAGGGAASYNADIPDGAGLALFRTGNPALFLTPAERLDAVGFTGSTFFEGAPLTPAGGITTPLEHSFARKETSGRPQDTDQNENDFYFLEVGGAGSNGRTAILGAPGPENTTSPVQRNGVIKASLIEPTAASTAPPNRVRSGQVQAGAPNAFGTLSIQRRFKNTTAFAVTRLRFRIVDITTLNSPVGGSPQADLRVLSSTGVVTNSQGTEVVTVTGLTLETPPAQANGGGLNSTLTVALPGGALAPGNTIDVQFLLGVQQQGGFRFLVNVEALPESAEASPGSPSNLKTRSTKAAGSRKLK
jgi:hypothetical protein